MRNLIYKVTKENATVYVNTLAEALTAKKNGSQIEPILADEVKALPKMTEKKKALRVQAIKP